MDERRLEASGAPVEANLHDAPALAGVQPVSVAVRRDGQSRRGDDWIVEEVPVAMVFNGISHAVMLASPADLEDFALGFALSEGLIESPAELYGVDVEPCPGGLELRLQVSAACEYRMKARRRSLAGRTGCGICGAESLDQVLRPMPQAPQALRIEPDAVAVALQSLRAAQAMQRLTGATHAAAWCEASGRAAFVREDVGRHNALDKLIGALHRAHRDAASGFIAVTSRASVEMVQKALMAGTGLLAAVSAPTTLAVQVARQHGLALAGFARGEDFVCYSGAERFGLAAGTETPAPGSAAA